MPLANVVLNRIFCDLIVKSILESILTCFFNLNILSSTCYQKKLFRSSCFYMWFTPDIQNLSGISPIHTFFKRNLDDIKCTQILSKSPRKTIEILMKCSGITSLKSEEKVQKCPWKLLKILEFSLNFFFIIDYFSNFCIIYFT